MYGAKVIRSFNLQRLRKFRQTKLASDSVTNYVQKGAVLLQNYK